MQICVKMLVFLRKKFLKKWINLLLDNNKQDRELIYFKILYLDKNKLDEGFFGEDSIDDNIYNRFYRTILKGSKFFFKNGITIKSIFHDISDNKENHPYFSWHTPHKLNIDEKEFKVEEDIIFIDSNHRNYFDENKLVYESQLIQFIDLILGVTSQILFNASKDDFRQEIAKSLYPLVKRLIETPYNYNSSFNYFQKQDISIFPKNKINHSEDLFGKKLKNDGEFHRDIKIREPTYINKKESLDNWF